MQPPTSFDWGRVVTPARWVARVLGLVLDGILGLGGLLAIALSATANYSNIFQNGILYVTWGLMFVGILVAAFWVGIGEVVGGLATVVGGVLTFALVSTPNWGSLALLSPFLLVGALFIACGWYTLAQRSHHATPITA